MRASLTLFLTAAVAFWLLACGVAWLAWPERRELFFVQSITAAGLCLIPSALTLAWALAGSSQSPEQRRLVALGGTVVRLFFVLGAGLLLTSIIDYFRGTSFWLWVLVFYLFTLALEMVIVIRALGEQDQRGASAP